MRRSPKLIDYFYATLGSWSKAEEAVERFEEQQLEKEIKESINGEDE